jgi:hypothetical protein
MAARGKKFNGDNDHFMHYMNAWRCAWRPLLRRPACSKTSQPMA